MNHKILQPVIRDLKIRSKMIVKIKEVNFLLNLKNKTLTITHKIITKKKIKKK